MDSQPRRILSIKTVLDRVPYSRTTVWRKSRDPDDPFPAAVDIGPNRTGIYEDEFDSWLDGLSRRGASPTMIEGSESKPADEAEANAASQSSPLVEPKAS